MLIQYLAFSSLALFTPCEKGPVVDGVIRDGEYSRGVAFARPGGTVFFAADSRCFYAAWRSKARNNDPGGGMCMKSTRRDDKLVCLDDAIDLVLENPDTGDAFHLAINAGGNIFDRRRLAKRGWDNDWNCPGIKVESLARSGVWELEAAIPMKSLNLKGTRIRVNVMRESPTEAAWAFCPGDPFDGNKIELDWSETVPCFHMIGVGDPASGVWRPELACVWAPEGAETMAFLRLEEVDKGGAVVETPVRKQKLLKSGMTLQGRHTTLSRAGFRASVSARIHPGKKELFSDTFVARRGAKIGNVPPYAEFDLGMKASGVCLYYPGQNRARFSVVANGEMKSVAVTVAGRTASLKVQPDGVWTALIDVPDKHGPFEVSFVADGERYANVCKIEKKRFGWENNKIGKERVIVPPFKPIRAQGAGADVLLRKYAFDGAGLLASVKALDREILAAPVHFEVTRGAHTEVLEPTGSGTVTVAADGCDATFSGSAIASKLGFKCRGRLEYDGFIWNEMTVTSGDTVDRLTLVIPMKDDEASLMHIVAADTIRHNPSGFVPQGDGVVFDSSTMYRKPECAEDLYPYSAVPYAWLGGPECGLSWFINDAKGMVLDTRKGAVRIVRQGGVLRLECDFVNRPTKLSNGHRLTFGFEATPVKRADPELRRHLQNSTDPVPEGMMRRLGVNWKATAFSNHWARVPWQGDWSKFDAANARPDAFTFKYSDPALAWKDEADTLQYQSEWVSRGTGYGGARRIFLVPSAIDFVLYRFNEWMDHGLEGLYFDDSYVIPCRNADTSGGHFGILETRELMKRTAVMQHLRGVKPRLIQVHATNALLIPAFAFATSTLSWEDHYGEEPFPRRFPIDYVLAESMGTQIGCEGIVLDGCRRKKSPKDGWNDKLAMLTRSQLAILLPAGMSVWCRSGKELHRPEYLAAYATVAKMKPWDAATEFLPFWKKPVPVPEGVIGALYRRGKDELAVFGNLTDTQKSFEFHGKRILLEPYDYSFSGTVEPVAPVSLEKRPKASSRKPPADKTTARANGSCALYVDPVKGNDTNDGLGAERPLRTLEQAVKSLRPGDTLHLANGATFRESLSIKSGGTAAAPIRILGHGATLTGREAIPDNSWIDKGNGLWLSPNRGYVGACRPRVLDASGNMISGSNKDPEFADPSCLAVGRATWNKDGVWFRPATGRHPRESRLSGYFRVSGVVIKDASNIVVEDIVVENFSNDGINVHGDSTGLVFRNVISRNNGDDGFSIHDTVQAKVEGLHAFGNDYGIQDIGTSRSDFAGSLIESNRIYGVDFHGGVRSLRETVVRDNGRQQIRATEQKCKPGAADAGSPLYKAQVRLEKVTVTAGGRPSVYVEKGSRIVAVGCSFDGEIRKAKGGIFEEEGK